MFNWYNESQILLMNQIWKINNALVYTGLILNYEFHINQTECKKTREQIL